jgi:hypothetical protein
MTERTSKREARERLREMLLEANEPEPRGSIGDPHPEEARSAVAKDEAEVPRTCMVRDAASRLLTMRGESEAPPNFLPPAPTKLEQTAPALTDVVRALYEEGVVPVAEIARLAGVAERTIYKYVARGGWQRRDAARGPAVAAANRGRPWTRPDGFAQSRGAGGRYLGPDDEDSGGRGLKALDPGGRAQAAAKATTLARLSADALARTEAVRLTKLNVKTLAELVRFARDLFERERAGNASSLAQVGPARLAGRNGRHRKHPMSVRGRWRA